MPKRSLWSVKFLIKICNPFYFSIVWPNPSPTASPISPPFFPPIAVPIVLPITPPIFLPVLPLPPISLDVNVSSPPFYHLYFPKKTKIAF
jgi:hypothetical protein